MNVVFHGNFDFEHELADPLYQPTQTLRRLNAEFAFHGGSLAEMGDVIALPELPQPEFLRHWSELAGGARWCQTNGSRARGRSVLVSECERTVSPDESGHDERWSADELVPWGWSEAVRRRWAKSSIKLNGPETHAVRAANSRRFSHELETRHGLVLDGSQVIQRLDDVARAVRTVAGQRGCAVDEVGWVIKAEFGMSARERVLGRCLELSAPSRGWIEKRLSRGEWLIFEPWLERLSEYGVLFRISPTETEPKVSLVAMTELLTDAAGRYRGTRVPSPTDDMNSEEAAVVRRLTAFVADIAQTGYFGPIGIDVMRYRNSVGEVVWRLVQDVNARWTMGFVANGWAKKLAEGRAAQWLHVETTEFCSWWGRAPSPEFETELCRDTGRLIASLPGAIEDDTRHPTLTGQRASSGRRAGVPILQNCEFAVRQARAVWLTSPIWLGEQATRQVSLLVVPETDAEQTER